MEKRKLFITVLFFRKIIEIKRFPLQAAILYECQNYLGDGGGLGGSQNSLGETETVNFHHEHCIVPTDCPWVSEDDVSTTLLIQSQVTQAHCCVMYGFHNVSKYREHMGRSLGLEIC